MTNFYNVQDIPLNDILADPSFNCRGIIAPIDVVELAKDIEQHKLQNPIIVQNIDPKNNIGKDFRIVAGHRRYSAFKVLKKETIPLRIGSISSTSARLGTPISISSSFTPFFFLVGSGGVEDRLPNSST